MPLESPKTQSVQSKEDKLTTRAPEGSKDRSLPTFAQTEGLFQDKSQLNLAIALQAVAEANPIQLGKIIALDPEILFKKGKVKTPAGELIEDISPYQLMIFLGDAKMVQEIMPRINMTESMEVLRHKQNHEIAYGGPDLIKMDVDPRTLSFDKIRFREEVYDIANELYYYGLNFETYEVKVTFPLLDNVNGVIYYHNKDSNKDFFFLANKKEEKIYEIAIQWETLSEQDSSDLKKLIKSFETMPNNSSRRSSNAEHDLILRTMTYLSHGCYTPVKLYRQGIHYKDVNNVAYLDYRFDFNQYYNAVRNHIDIHKNGCWSLTQAAWDQVGLCQKKLIWLIQLICQKGLNFHQFPNYMDIDNHRTTYLFDERNVFDSGTVDKDSLYSQLGCNFSLVKSPSGYGWKDESGYEQDIERTVRGSVDFIAICKLIEGAKVLLNQEINTIESTSNSIPRYAT